jgi:multidrug efflux pump subunit AcrA (membrane-fusion protein)
VRVQKLQPVQVADTLELAGTLAPVRRAVLSTRITGRISYLAVEEGDAVGPGEVLVRVDTSDVQARLSGARAALEMARASQAQAETAVSTARAARRQAAANVSALEAQIAEARAQLDLARLERDRYRQMLRDGVVPRQQADFRETEYRVAQARLAQLQASREQARAAQSAADSAVAEAQASAARAASAVQAAGAEVQLAMADLQYGEVAAPFAGVVTSKLARAGELASAGSPLLEVQDVRLLRLEAAVPEEELPRLHPHQRVSVRLAGGQQLPGRVRQIVPSADPGTRTFLVKIDVPNPGQLIPGMYGQLLLPRGSRSLLLVPPRAVVRRGQLEGVFVAEAGRARLRLIKVGQAYQQGLEVLSGLSPGDPIVVNPPPALADGDPLLETGP